MLTILEAQNPSAFNVILPYINGYSLAEINTFVSKLNTCDYDELVDFVDVTCCRKYKVLMEICGNELREVMS